MSNGESMRTAAGRDIITERLRLVSLNEKALNAVAANDFATLSLLIGAQVSADCDLPADVARIRLSQLDDDPTQRGWLLRAIVRSDDATMIGHIGFHSAPNPPYLLELASGAVEIGYSVYTPYRRRGYAFESALGLMRWATDTHNVNEFVASVSPGNTASLGMLHKLSERYTLQTIGTYEDPEDGREDIYLLRTAAH